MILIKNFMRTSKTGIRIKYLCCKFGIALSTISRQQNMQTQVNNPHASMLYACIMCSIYPTVHTLFLLCSPPYGNRSHGQNLTKKKNHNTNV